MRAPNGDDANSVPGWRRGFQVFAIALVVLLVAFLFFRLFLESGVGREHGPPPFLQSLGFTGLVVTFGYLAALSAWAVFRREETFVVRQLGSAAAMLLLVVLYLNTRGGFGYNQHSWNQSFADASVVLYAATLAIGPLARLWRPARHALDWRRETGIWATIAAALHVGIFWEGTFGWNGWKQFFYASGDGSGRLAPTAFSVANAIGVVALVYAIVLTVTSNDASQGWLKGGWSWLMKRATTMQILVLLHTWIFAYYITRESIVLVGTLWASFWIVLVLQTAAFIKTVWLRRSGRFAEGKAPVVPT